MLGAKLSKTSPINPDASKTSRSSSAFVEAGGCAAQFDGAADPSSASSTWADVVADPIATVTCDFRSSGCFRTATSGTRRATVNRSDAFVLSSVITTLAGSVFAGTLIVSEQSPARGCGSIAGNAACALARCASANTAAMATQTVRDFIDPFPYAHTRTMGARGLALFPWRQTRRLPLT